MGARDDDDKPYTTYDDITGRSIRRGARKAAKALTFGVLGGDPVGNTARSLAADAAEELATKVAPRARRD